MRWAKHTFIAIAFVVSSAARAQATHGLDIKTLEAAERRWAQAAVQDYKFTFRYGEFVSPCKSFVYRVLVSNGASQQWSDCQKYWAKFSSVPLLFQYLHRALARKPHTIEVEFDPTLGYPISASVKWSELTDDFFSFEVTDFRVEK